MTPADRIPDLRQEIDQLILAGSADSAAARIRELWRCEPAPASASFIVSRTEKLRDRLALFPYRVAVLRSFTVEPAIPLLRAAAFCYGIDLQVHVGDFNGYMQEILDPSSSLYRFEPNSVIFAVRTADCATDLWQDFSSLAPDARRESVRRVAGTFEQCIASFRHRSQASLIVHTLEQLPRPSLGVLDSQVESSQSDCIQSINSDLRRMAREQHGVYLLDYDALVARQGRLLWQDERKWLTVRLPIAAHQLVHLANEWLRLLIPLTGKVAKALVVDLDNTLWGGVIGEDGMTGIKLGSEYPGAAFQSLQRAMLDLSRKGILLAICSKNNSDDAMEVLEKHPGMLLRPKHFAAMRINWNDKAQGLREIAAELNIGIDSLAFLDDNPVEREQVRGSLPEVLVIDFPDDPVKYATVVRDCPAFERLTLSSEDQQRTAMYAEQRQRAHAEQSFQTKEDFYRYLQQEAEVAPVVPATLARVAQLTQKTNQFNLTTRRYAEQQVSELAAKPGWHVLSIRVKDRFGDHGLVGVAITRDEQNVREIDTFLLSCRVIGRSVETALLSYLAEDAKARGCRQLSGWFLPTKKNAPAKEFYRQHGFECQTRNGEGSLWVLDLKQGQIACPDWIKLNVINGGNS
jgi:FkbH-like protein